MKQLIKPYIINKELEAVYKAAKDIKAKEKASAWIKGLIGNLF